MTIKGSQILDEATTRLSIDLPALVAACAFWVPANDNAIRPVSPRVRRARSDEKRGMVTPDGSLLDDNTFANRVPKTALSHLGKFEGFAVCHIWPQTCYDERYHTLPANLVLLPRELAGLTDHNLLVEQCLKYRAWELYKWHPKDQPAPKKPENYPSNWREPVPPPIASSEPVCARTTRDSLPIQLIPSESDAFRNAFISRGLAEMAIHYQDGRIENQVWPCQRFGPKSNVMGNLRSRAQFRSGIWQQLGIRNVVVKIPD